MSKTFRTNILQHGNVVTPVAIAGNVADYAPAGSDIQISQQFRQALSASAVISGLGLPIANREVTIENIETNPALTLTVLNQGNPSVSTNRVVTTSGANVVICAGGSARFRYDTTINRWRQVPTNLFGDFIHTHGVIYTTIQAAIDASSALGGGPVYLPVAPAATPLTISTPIILPRTDLDGNGSVPLIGPGSNTCVIQPSNPTDALWIGRGMVEWAAPVGAIRRAFHQTFKGIRFLNHRQDGYIIHYVNTDVVAPLNQRSSYVMEDVIFETYNDFDQTAVRLEGNVHDSTFNYIWFDPRSLGATNFDTKCFVFDDGTGLDNGNDDFCAYQCSFRDITTNALHNGVSQFWRGRGMFIHMSRIQIGHGSIGLPIFHIVNSGAWHVDTLNTEGLAESPSILIENSRSITFNTFTLGTPNAYLGHPIGGGIVGVNSHGCRIKRWIAYPEKPRWDMLVPPQYRVDLDALCSDWEVDIDITDGAVVGPETIDSVTQDLGVFNLIQTTDAFTNQIVERYNLAFTTNWVNTLTPAALAGAVNDYAPVDAANGLAPETILRQNCTAASVITGLVGGVNGRVLTISNITAVLANTLTINHLDGASAAINQFALPANAALVIPANGSATFRYDGTSAVWRVISA